MCYIYTQNYNVEATVVVRFHLYSRQAATGNYLFQLNDILTVINIHDLPLSQSNQSPVMTSDDVALSESMHKNENYL